MKFFLSLLTLATLTFATSSYACGESAADPAQGFLTAGKSIKECAATKDYLNSNLIDRNAASGNGGDTPSTATKAKGKEIHND